MKFKYLLPICFLLIGSFSCQNSKQSSLKLESDKCLTEVFTSNELKDIQSMINYVDSAVIAFSGNSNVKEAYPEYLNRYFESFANVTKENDARILLFNSDEKYAFLESLDQNVFESFWRFNSHYEKLWDSKRDTLLEDVDYIRDLCLNISGKYIKYLECVGKEDADFKALYEHFRSMGDISPIAFQLHKHENFDVNSLKYRLLTVVFILRIEETIQSKLDKHFNTRQL